MQEQIEAVRAFNRFYTDFLGLLNQDLYGAPVTLGEARVLLEIGHAPGIRARDLMGLLSMDRGHLSRTLGRLEQRGFIAPPPPGGRPPYPGHLPHRAGPQAPGRAGEALQGPDTGHPENA